MGKKKRTIKKEPKEGKKGPVPSKEAAQPMLEGIKAFMQKFRDDVNTKKKAYQDYASKFRKPKTK